MIAKVILVTLLALSVSCEQLDAIPNTPDGYSIGGGITAPIHIEAFVDLLCPDSQYSWGQLLPLLDQFNVWTNKTIRFTVHILPLDYHRYAFIVAQGLRIINDNANNSRDVWTYMNTSFNNQQWFYNTVAVNWTAEEVYTNLTSMALEALPAYEDVFFEGLTYEDTYDDETRNSWSYAMSRYVTGTPTFFYNGVYIDGADGFNTTEWIPYFEGELPSEDTDYCPGQKKSGRI